jgi:catechol 2,3-dioxygenase
MQTSHRPQDSTEAEPVLHPATEVGAVTLKTANLERSLEFYTRVIGLQPLQQDEERAMLGAGRRPILWLQEVPAARRPPANATGLYHAAILFPDRHALAVKIAQIEALHYPYGFADHRVSEAFYLSDPDGNGLELYRDRPRDEWAWDDKGVRMASDPIDFESFFAEVKEGDETLAKPAAPVGTKLGHVHLRIADVDAAEQFYHGKLGFDVTARWPGALFLSAGGYHHHLGMNTWESRGGKPPAGPSTGLGEFSIVLPDREELERLAQRLTAAQVTVERDGDTVLIWDPFQNKIRLVTQERLMTPGL